MNDDEDDNDDACLQRRTKIFCCSLCFKSIKSNQCFKSNQFVVIDDDGHDFVNNNNCAIAASSSAAADITITDYNR